jgi:hypothetical protein
MTKESCEPVALGIGAGFVPLRAKSPLPAANAAAAVNFDFLL